MWMQKGRLQNFSSLWQYIAPILQCICKDVSLRETAEVFSHQFYHSSYWHFLIMEVLLNLKRDGTFTFRLMVLPSYHLPEVLDDSGLEDACTGVLLVGAADVMDEVIGTLHHHFNVSHFPVEVIWKLYQNLKKCKIVVKRKLPECLEDICKFYQILIICQIRRGSMKKAKLQISYQHWIR